MKGPPSICLNPCNLDTEKYERAHTLKILSTFTEYNEYIEHTKENKYNNV